MEQLIASLSAYLDPDVVWPLVLTWSGRVLSALAIFLIGRLVVRGLTRWFGRAVHRVGMDATLSRFLGNLIYMVLLVFIVLTAVNALGVPTTNFLAVLGAAGLAIGLALKDSLSNFASGVMLVVFRPFKVDDYIEAAGVSGSVESIGIFNTIVKTPDNRVITVPNRLIYAGTITNFSAEPTRRIDLTIAVANHADPVETRGLITALVEADTRIAKQPRPAVAVQDLLPSHVVIAVRVWVGAGDFGAVRGDLLERIKQALDERGMSFGPPRPLQPLAGAVK